MGTVTCVYWGVPQVRPHSQRTDTEGARVLQQGAQAAYAAASALASSAKRGYMQQQTETCCRVSIGNRQRGMLERTGTPGSRVHAWDRQMVEIIVRSRIWVKRCQGAGDGMGLKSACTLGLSCTSGWRGASEDHWR